MAAGNWDTETTNWTTTVGATNEFDANWQRSTWEDLIFGGGTAGTAGTVTLTATGNDYGSIEFLATNAGTYTIDLNGQEVELRRSANTFLIGEDATITDIAGGGTLTLDGSRQFNFTDNTQDPVYQCRDRRRRGDVFSGHRRHARPLRGQHLHFSSRH